MFRCSSPSPPASQSEIHPNDSSRQPEVIEAPATAAAPTDSVGFGRPAVAVSSVVMVGDTRLKLTEAAIEESRNMITVIAGAKRFWTLFHGPSTFGSGFERHGGMTYEELWIKEPQREPRGADLAVLILVIL